MIGTQLGNYSVIASLGQGGMGEVWRATDSKLGREVAIKTLPASLASDKDRLARFEREAKLLASLNHAHIASVYGLDEHEGTLYIAMELVEGETLEGKLRAGPLPVEEALQLALQIALALEAAHERGVVHRDLKPANVMVTPGGVVKVLDFGLAKAFAGNPSEASPAHSPALSIAMTQQGLVLGTAAYMSPEQASGQATDQRADVWAFGVVAYEMLTGHPLFAGESVPHILADVLRAEPDWSRLPGKLHPRIRQMLERCLAKKPRNRYVGIADARVDIETALKDPRGLLVESIAGGDNAAARRPLWRRSLPAAAVLVVGVLAAGAAWLAKPVPSWPVNRFESLIPSTQTFRSRGRNVFAFAPDGRSFVYNTGDGLYLRRLDQLTADVIRGTEPQLNTPFYAPDGQSIAYNLPLSSQQLTRIAVSGGAPVAIGSAGADSPFGAVWGEDGVIVFGGEDGIYRVPATGGVPERAIAIDGARGVYVSARLPDGETVIAAERPNDTAEWDRSDIVAYSLATGERTLLVAGGMDARYVPTGHLVYALGDTLFGIAFDAKSLRVSGGPVPLVQGVQRAGNTGAANFGIARDGTLAYLEGTGTGQNTLVWVDRSGHEEPIDIPPRRYMYAQLSPDGTRIALDSRDEDNDIWVFDLGRKTLQRLTFNADLDRAPLWSPDGRRIAFTSRLESGEDVYWQAADGSGAAELLARSPGAVPLYASGFTPASDAVVLSQGTNDVFLARIGDPDDASPLIATPTREFNAAVSPDGRWLAYQSDESGRSEVYVRPFPGVDTGRWQISTTGGTRPRWSRDGRELYFFRESDASSSEIVAVPVVSSETFRAGIPETILRGAYAAPNALGGIYDVSADSQRFLLIKRTAGGEAAPQARVVIVEHWTEELKRLVPTD
jgi:serine/threonine protein kinase